MKVINATPHTTYRIATCELPGHDRAIAIMQTSGNSGIGIEIYRSAALEVAQAILGELGDKKTCPYCNEPIPAERQRRADLHGHCSHGCRLASELPTSNHGQTIVSSDAMAESGHPVPEPLTMEADDITVREEMLQVLSMFVSQFMGLPRATRDVVCWRFLDLCGERYTFGDIGLAAGVSPQAAEQRLNEAIRLSPAIRAMFAGKVAKREVRKV